jgi:hypothetical protein
MRCVVCGKEAVDWHKGVSMCQSCINSEADDSVLEETDQVSPGQRESFVLQCIDCGANYRSGGGQTLKVCPTCEGEYDWDLIDKYRRNKSGANVTSIREMFRWRSPFTHESAGIPHKRMIIRCGYCKRRIGIDTDPIAIRLCNDDIRRVQSGNPGFDIDDGMLESINALGLRSDVTTMGLFREVEMEPGVKEWNWKTSKQSLADFVRENVVPGRRVYVHQDNGGCRRDSVVTHINMLRPSRDNPVIADMSLRSGEHWNFYGSDATSPTEVVRVYMTDAPIIPQPNTKIEVEHTDEDESMWDPAIDDFSVEEVVQVPGGEA